MILAAIDTDALLKVVYSSLLIGIVIIGAFCVALYGLIRFDDARKGVGSTAGALFAVLGVLGLSVFVAAVVLGFLVMTSK